MPILLLVIILGIVEGVTEYLPVSSTGHLILATELLGFDAAAWAVFNVAIQPGAILAIVVLYWRTFRDVIVGLFQRSPSAIAFVRNILLAFLPAAVLGVALGDNIDMLLENAIVVCWALIIGGIAILIVERYARPKDCGGVAAVSMKQSALIGLVQCLAMIPGVSRSGATALQLFKHWDNIPTGQFAWIGLGSLVSFVVAIIVVKAFLAIVTRYGFAPFAWYRIVAGAIALAWLTMR